MKMKKVTMVIIGLLMLAISISISACAEWIPGAGKNIEGCFCPSISDVGLSSDTEGYIAKQRELYGDEAVIFFLEQEYGCDCTEARAALVDGDEEVVDGDASEVDGDEEISEGDDEYEGDDNLIPTPLWEVEVENVVGDPVVSNDEVVFLTTVDNSQSPLQRGRLLAIKDGEVNWFVNVDSPSSRPSINIYDGRVAVVGGDNLYVIDPTGFIVDVITVGTKNISSVAHWVGENIVLIVSNDGSLITVEDGEIHILSDGTGSYWEDGEYFLSHDQPLIKGYTVWLGGKCIRRISLQKGEVEDLYCKEEGLFWSPKKSEDTMVWMHTMGYYGTITEEGESDELSFSERVVSMGEENYASSPVWVDGVGVVATFFFVNNYTVTARVTGFDPETGKPTLGFSSENWFSDPVSGQGHLKGLVFSATPRHLVAFGPVVEGEWPEVQIFSLDDVVEGEITGRIEVFPSPGQARVFAVTDDNKLVAVSFPISGSVSVE